MIYAWDESGRAVYVSAEWEAFSGRPAADALGLGWVEQIHPDDRDMVYVTVCHASTHKTSFTARCRIRFADQRYVWVSTDASPCFSPIHRAFIGLMGSFAALDDQTEATASVTLGRCAPPCSVNSNSVDKAVDHLMIAKALIEAAGDDPASRAIDLSIFLLKRSMTRVRH